MIKKGLVLPNAIDIKTARIYLDMGQEELAKRVGIYKHTLLNIEKGNSSPTVEVLLKIAEYFFARNIVFHNNGGFEVLKDEVATVLSDENAYITILQDIFDNCAPMNERGLGGDEVLFLGNDDALSSEKVNQMHQQIYSKGVPYKFLITKENDYILGPLNEYRKIDKINFLSDNVVILYKDKVVFFIGEVNEKIIIIRDKDLKDKLSIYFYSCWNSAEECVRSSTKQIFFRN